VETFFHEFGHAMHTILTQAKYGRFSGTSVPRDFVEAPSQMLEAWAWNKTVLDRFAEDYQNPGRKIDASVLENLKRADLATKATFYRRQLALALTDQALHAAGEVKDSAKIMNKVFSDTFISLPEETNYAASWDHLNGYDSGYYGYAWADAISQDLLTAFESAPGGVMDSDVGMKLRNEIYAAGWSREIDHSIEAFLGRKTNLQAFFKSLGTD
jgi:thimet oligopeptidase